MNMIGPDGGWKNDVILFLLLFFGGIAFLLTRPFIIVKKLGKKVFRIGQRKL